MEMKLVSDLDLGFRDAESYKSRKNRERFNRIFVPNQTLDRLCDPNVYFSVGEKGTGKTADAVYMSNNNYKGHRSSLKYIRETDYQKFVQMKKEKNLNLSDYTNIWKVIIYLLISRDVTDGESKFPMIDGLFRFKQLNAAVEEYYQHAFSPEILYAIEFADEAKRAAEIVAKHAGVGGRLGVEKKASTNFSENRYQTNLLFIQRAFEDALTSLKLTQNHVLFIDGIDIRPSPIEYGNYLECVKGLANAIWSVNSDFFSNIRDSKGRLRVVLLIRPDIFDKLGLQNLNSKIHDNAAIQNWATTYQSYRRSELFSIADRMLSHQQSETLTLGVAWDHYFPYNTSNVNSPQTRKSSFISFLRYSLYRPRDILTILSIQRENLIEQGRAGTDLFSESDFSDPSFTRKYSDYILGEVKDQIVFYHSAEEYELFLKFFQFLDGKSRFDYTEYLQAFSEFSGFTTKNSELKPSFCKTPDIFLQFLYDHNIISYIADTEDGPFFGWCYRERSPSNIAPKVRTHARYEVHYGLMKAVDLGKKIRRSDRT